MARFLVHYTLTFVNRDQSQPLSIYVRAANESEARRQVTKDYIMKNVRSEWSVPIRNLRVQSIEEVDTD